MMAISLCKVSESAGFFVASRTERQSAQPLALQRRWAMLARPSWVGCLATLGLFSLMLVASQAHADDRIYRCGNEYTNTVTEAQAKTCKLLSGGNVTIIQTPPRSATAAAPNRQASGQATGQRIDSVDQKARDSDARRILESELKKAEVKQQDLAKEYNNGEPEKLASEVRNNQKYLDRIADLKAALSRNQSDIDGIRRELDRLSASATPNASTAAR